jgi:SAM-dependent methyltransferase
MRRTMRQINGALTLFGLDLSRMARSIRWLPKYVRDYRSFVQLDRIADNGFPVTRALPILAEHLSTAGTASGQYFYQDLHVARRVFELSPSRHLDIGSRVDGFVAHVAVFRAIEVVDIRPMSTSAKNIFFVQADLQDPAAAARIGQSDSVSCLHAVEHFGLGRYGDPIQVDGHLRGIRNVAALVSPGGRLHISVPMGPQRVEFNAHRVFAAETIPSLLETDFALDQFSFVDDVGDFHEKVPFVEDDIARHFGCYHGCGIYELLRRGST